LVFNVIILHDRCITKDLQSLICPLCAGGAEDRIDILAAELQAQQEYQDPAAAERSLS
jgi:hypothetical protein